MDQDTTEQLWAWAIIILSAPNVLYMLTFTRGFRVVPVNVETAVRRVLAIGMVSHEIFVILNKLNKYLYKKKITLIYCRPYPVTCSYYLIMYLLVQKLHNNFLQNSTKQSFSSKKKTKNKN